MAKFIQIYTLDPKMVFLNGYDSDNQLVFPNAKKARDFFTKESAKIKNKIEFHNCVIDKDSVEYVVLESCQESNPKQKETILKTNTGNIVLYYATRNIAETEVDVDTDNNEESKPKKKQKVVIVNDQIDSNKVDEDLVTISNL